MNNVNSIASQRADLHKKERMVEDEHKKNLDLINERFKSQKEFIHQKADEDSARIRLKTDTKLMQEAQREEEKLKKIKEATEETKKLIEDEVKNFKNLKDQEVAQKQMSNEEKFHSMNREFEKMANNQQEDYQKRLYETSNQNREDISHQDNNFYLELRDHTVRNADRLDAVDSDFKNRYQNNQLKFNQALTEQEKLGLKDLEKMNQGYTKQKDDQKNTNEMLIAKNKLFYKQTLDELKKEFERKFVERQNFQFNFLKKLDEDHQKEIRKVMDDFSTKKASIVSKMDDPFYRSTFLDPVVEDNDKAYLIKLPMPEHEKGLVQISGHDRKIKLTMAREFADKVVSPAGDEANSKRFETFSKELFVPQIIDARKVTREWKNGELVFTMPKK